MKIAIIGAGFCGLALSYHVLTTSKRHNISAEITLFDSKGIGNGASGAAAGLVHPYAGKKANLSYKGSEAFSESLFLLKHMDTYSQTVFQKPVIIQRGILRPAALPEQNTFFYNRSCQLDQFRAHYLSAEESKKLYPNPHNLPSLYIPDGLAIDCRQYLDALYSYCMSYESLFSFRQEYVSTINAVKQSGFDIVLVCAGYLSDVFFENHPPIGKVKGQKLNKRIPDFFPIPQCGLSSTAYAVFSSSYVCLGSTYEHMYQSLEPDREAAEKELTKKIGLFWPDILDYPTTDISAGIRATTSTSHPIVLFKTPDIWSITGVGSKGLLYHSWLAKAVAQAICKLITPEEVSGILGNTILSQI